MNRSGFHDMYIGNWCDILDTKRSILGDPRALQIILNFSGFRFHSFEFATDRDWKWASTLRFYNNCDPIYYKVIPNFLEQSWKNLLGVPHPFHLFDVRKCHHIVHLQMSYFYFWKHFCKCHYGKLSCFQFKYIDMFSIPIRRAPNFSLKHLMLSIFEVPMSIVTCVA